MIGKKTDSVKNSEQVRLEGEIVEGMAARQVCPTVPTIYKLVGEAGAGELSGGVMIAVETLKPPASPGQLSSGSRVCTDQAYSVTLDWIDVTGNEEGYRV